jgi:catechol 2,3-dioxygenase-like lactoylglutathione lyase family enzyme
MTRRIGLAAVVVADYDDALVWYRDKLGFVVEEDTLLGDGKRWVIVTPERGSETRLLLARADSEAQRAAVGNQTGGRVFLFLRTDDFASDHARMLKNGVRFLEAPRHESYGTAAVFEDLYGNRWDLIENART